MNSNNETIAEAKVRDKISYLKRIGTEIKFGIVIIDIIMTIYVLWLIITNDSSWLIGVLFGFTPYGVYLLFKASKLFGFCVIHKLMLAHTVCVYICCVYQAYFGFDEYLPYFRWIMFITGAFLSINVIVKTMLLMFKLSIR